MSYRKLQPEMKFTAVFAFMIMGCVSAQAQDITRIEEDWQARVIESDSEITAPQLTSVMTPDSYDSASYFSFEMNHTTSPEFTPGGLQIQSWVDDSILDSSTRLANETLNSQDEKIKWTQVLDVKDGALSFEITAFQSLTWQLDGRNASLTNPNYGSDNLNNYRISNSIEFSTVGFSGNRVGYMMLMQVRTYSGNQHLHTYTVNRNVNRGHQTLLED